MVMDVRAAEWKIQSGLNQGHRLSKKYQLKLK